MVRFGQHVYLVLPIPFVMETINQISHIEGIIITRDNRLAVSDGLKNTFSTFH